MRNADKKTAIIFGTAVCLDLISMGGTASATAILAKSGLDGIFQSIKNVSKDASSNFLGSHLSKQFEKHLENNLGAALQHAAEQTLDSVRQIFIEDNDLRVNLKERIRELLGDGIPAKKALEQHALATYFFDPLKEAFRYSDTVSKVFSGQKQLKPGEWIEMLLDSKNLHFPEFRKEQQPLVRKALIEGFNEQFLIYFISELTNNPKARDEYLTLLLHSQIEQMTVLEKNQDEIRSDLKILIDLARWYEIEIDQIISQQENVQNKLYKIDKNINRLRTEFFKSRELLLDIYRKRKDEADASQQFRYESLYTNFVGRYKEMEYFRAFLNDERPFCWTILCGDAGTGKSRLANEVCLRAENVHWISGFSRYGQNENFLWETFDFRANTLIVFDYYSGRKEEIHKVLDVLSTKANIKGLSKKMRVLLIEREISHSEMEQLFFTTNILLKETFFKNRKHDSVPEPYRLTTLEDEARWHIICQVAVGSDYEQDILTHKEEIMSQLDQQDPQKRPLFAFFTGIALAEGQNVTDWNTNDNLLFHLQRQEYKIWKKTSIWEKYSRGLKNLICIATICEYITFDDIYIIHAEDERILGFDPESLSEKEVIELESLFNKIIIEETALFIGIKPDLLGEFYIISRIVEMERDAILKKIWPGLLELAWKIRPERAWFMIYLIYKNYEGHSGLDCILECLNELPMQKESAPFLGNLYFAIASIFELKHLEFAVHLYKKASKYDNLFAMTNLGAYYLEKGQYVQAEDYLRKAADKGIVQAINNLGVLFNRKGDFAQAEFYTRQAAEMGHIEANVVLGSIYKKKGDMDQAISYWKVAIDQGYKDAKVMNNLGVLFERKGDFTQAELYYKQAADNGLLEAMYPLGWILYRNDNLDQAEFYWKRAADQGHLEAMNDLGVFYKEKDDMDNAELYWKQAAEHGFVGAMNNMGLLLMKKGDFDRSEFYFKQAVDKGHLESMNPLGWIFYKKGSLEQAEFYWKQTADQGDIISMFNLGALFEVRGEMKQAVTYYKQSADLGNVEASFNLGALAEDEGDLIQAEFYYKQSADQGFEQAINYLGAFYEKIGNMERAEYYRRQAAAQGHTESMFNLGGYFYKKNDMEQAEYYWKQAAEQGHLKAMSNMACINLQMYQSKNDAWKYIQQALSEDSNNIELEINYIIISVWTGNTSDFKNDLCRVIERLVLNNQTEFLKFLFTSLLVFTNSMVILQHFEEGKHAKYLRKHLRVLHYVSLHFSQSNDPRLLNIPEDIKKEIGELVTQVKEEREFYGSIT